MDERTKQLLSLGREHYEQRDFEKAEHYLSKVVAKHDEYADVHNMLGVIFHDQGKFDDAQRHFESAYRINPRYTEAALNLAVTYNDLGRYEDAKKIYRATMNQGSGEHIDPYARGKIANLHAQVSQAYLDANMTSEAMHELRKAVTLCPSFADLRLRLANLYRQQGDLEGAEHELREALNAKPGYVPALVALGVVLLGQGEHDDALETWEEALNIDPNDKAATMYLRMARHLSSTGSDLSVVVGIPKSTQKPIDIE